MLQARCQGCHSAPPVQGAPFPLLTQADFLAPYFASSVQTAAVGAVQVDFMPLNGPPLDAAQKAILVGWLDAGLPLSSTKCP